jgi:putative endopeptidase
MRTHEQLLAVGLALALSSWPVFPSSAQETVRLQSPVDASITPGDDFYGYANGGWLKATAIPAGREQWGARDELKEQARIRMAALLDDAGAAPVGSAARKVATSAPLT